MILADLTATFEHDAEDGYQQEHSTGAMTSLRHKVALKYDYAIASQDVFRCHDNCGCRAIYECENTRQDIWSKQSWTAVDSEASDKAVNYTPSKLTTEQANAVEQEKLSQFMPLTVENRVKVIDISGKSGIIKENRKSVEIPEDCTYLLKAETNFENKNVSEDVLRAIDMTISNRYAENADFQFDEIKLARFSDSDARSLFITNLEVRGITKKSQLYLNRDFFVDVEKSGIDKMCEAYFHSGWWMSRTLEDLVNHEIMHGRINHYNSFEKVNQLYQFLREDDRVKGLCKLVDKYPDEFLNEMYVVKRSKRSMLMCTMSISVTI